MNFLNKYDSYKKKYQICEGNNKSITSGIQQVILNNLFGGRTYKSLNKEEQQQLQRKLKGELLFYDNIVNKITHNKQYQSWIYDVLKQQYEVYNKSGEFNDFEFNLYTIEQLQQTFVDYANICRSPKIDSDQKNIFNFDSIKSLKTFIKTFIQNNTKNIKFNFNKMYSNNSYDIYTVYLKDKQLFQHIYGPTGYNCGWCVAHDDNIYFENYLKHNVNDCYYLWTYKGTNKPFALLHYNSNQFKDIHNNSMNDYSDDVLDGLFNLCDNSTSYIHGDLCGYVNLIIKKVIEKYPINQAFCRIFKIFNFYVNDIGLICCDDNVDICLLELISDFRSLFIDDNVGELKISFGKICGSLWVDSLNLSSLKGCPNEVGNIFCCSENNIKNLIGGPTNELESYICTYNNNLTSLEGAPKKVRHRFNCNSCNLTSLVNSPEEVEIFNCGKNNLTSLIGGPKKTSTYICSYNKLQNLDGIGEVSGEVKCRCNLFNKED